MRHLDLFAGVGGFSRAAWADGSWEADLSRVVSDEVDRRPKLRAAGNAIVPLVAYELLSVMFAQERAA